LVSEAADCGVGRNVGALIGAGVGEEGARVGERVGGRFGGAGNVGSAVGTRTCPVGDIVGIGGALGDLVPISVGVHVMPMAQGTKNADVSLSPKSPDPLAKTS
jgi:hypothetical protein